MTTDFTAARVNMVENQVRTNDVTDLPIQDAMRVVARERLCRPGKAYLAYAEATPEYAPGLYLMQPRDVSKLLQAVYPEPGETALAIAAPYAALLLDNMGLKTTLRLPSEEAAAAVADALRGSGVTVSVGPLDAPADALGGPYKVVVCEGAVSSAPKSWQDVVAVGGRMGVVEREGPAGQAYLYLRGEDGLIGRRDVFDASPQVLAGFERKPQFTF